MRSRRRIRTSTQPTYQGLNSKIPTVNDNLQRGEPAFSLTKSLRPGGRTRRTSSVPPAQEKRQWMTASFAGPQFSAACLGVRGFVEVMESMPLVMVPTVMLDRTGVV